MLLALAARKPAKLRRYYYPFVAVSGLGVGMWAAGIGTIAVGSGTLDGGQLVTDYAAYPFLFGFAALVAGASRCYIAGVVGLTGETTEGGRGNRKPARRTPRGGPE